MVLIPWRAGCPHRERALGWVTQQLGHAVILGTHDEGPWCKAKALADAVARSDADVLVVHDADVWCDGLDEAISQVQAGAAWAVPHRMVHRLTEEATADRLAGGTATDLEQRPYLGYPGGGITVLRRDVWDRVPLDPRFAGWGQEDEAWALALTTMFGAPWRGRADLIHLWHPPQERKSRAVGSDESKRLLRHYQRARRSPVLMTELLQEVTP